MAYNSQIHNRHSIRLKGYDYTRTGAYFITACLQDRLHLFGEIINGKMQLNEMGEIVTSSWKWLSEQYDYVGLDEMIIMPDHIHGIIIITDHCMGDSRIAPDILPQTAPDILPQTAPDILPRTAPDILPQIAPDILPRTAPDITVKRKTIGRLIGAFKTVSTKQINVYRNTQGTRIWQRNYYEHIIRNNAELNRIRYYISNNVILWENDKDHINGKTKQ
ncbi:MAG: hypothetical protein JXN62_13235 [Bacteroidales bacterium]|nr:hypothetical protein [Bacteroidales bacterium]